MSPLTLYLAKLLGAVFLVMAAMMASKGPAIAETARRMIADPGFVMVSGAMRVVIGFAMAIGHDEWSGGALPVAVTLMGWAILFSGLFLLFATQERIQSAVDGMNLERNLPAYAGGLGLVGLYFLVAGLVG
ncbi:MAG: hypothetical protein WB816_04570 [Methylocystis sp.]